MSKTIGVFDFSFDETGPNEVHFVLRGISRFEQNLVDSEIDAFVAELKADLDAVGKKAKAALHRRGKPSLFEA